jgi:hypothetical protein
MKCNRDKCHYTGHTLETDQKYVPVLGVIDHSGAKFGFTIRYVRKILYSNTITVIF